MIGAGDDAELVTLRPGIRHRAIGMYAADIVVHGIFLGSRFGSLSDQIRALPRSGCVGDRESLRGRISSYRSFVSSGATSPAEPQDRLRAPGPVRETRRALTHMKRSHSAVGPVREEHVPRPEWIDDAALISENGRVASGTLYMSVIFAEYHDSRMP
jgi:hypothetical protein